MKFLRPVWKQTGLFFVKGKSGEGVTLAHRETRGVGWVLLENRNPIEAAFWGAFVGIQQYESIWGR
jgi:hypothetical protein